MRWLDFNTDPIPVVEPDGRVVMEGARETLDTFLQVIPSQENDES